MRGAEDDTRWFAMLTSLKWNLLQPDDGIVKTSCDVIFAVVDVCSRFKQHFRNIRMYISHKFKLKQPILFVAIWILGPETRRRHHT